MVPVPTVLESEQIHVGDRALIEHLDAYSAPRLVEYFDEDPCGRGPEFEPRASAAAARGALRRTRMAERAGRRSASPSRRSYTVGEYDILILSAKQSAGLETWLRENGYRIPPGASRVLGSYLKQGMKFFVAKVNLEGAGEARLHVPAPAPDRLRVAQVHAADPARHGERRRPQELFVYALTRKGRVETTNYRTVQAALGDEILPIYVKERVRRLLPRDVRRAGAEARTCARCSSSTLGHGLVRPVRRRAAVAGRAAPARRVLARRTPRGRAPGTRRSPAPGDVFVTRLHVRYDAAHFPEDLVFQETADRANFQGRYVLRHPWKGDASCPGGEPTASAARPTTRRPAISRRSPAGPSRRSAGRRGPSPMARRIAAGGGSASSRNSYERASASSSRLRTTGHSAATIE